MYFNFYYNNFFFNFLPSILVIFSIYIVAILVNDKFKEKYNVVLGGFGSIVYFFLIFGIFSIFINIILIFEKINFISYFVIFFLFSIFVILILNIKKISFLIRYFNKNNFSKFILIILIFFTLISILPLSDADSISSHLYFPIKIIQFKNLNFNLFKDLEIIAFSNNEIILFLSTILKSDNFGSILNIFTLVLFYIFFKNKKNFFILIITCPVILFLISTQKLQLFFGLMYLLISIIIFEKKYSNNFEKTLLIFLSVFYASGKTYYALFIIPLIVIFLIQNKEDMTQLFLKYLISFFIIYFPILLLKYKLFHDPFAPFLSSVFDAGNVNKVISYSLRSSEGWIGKSLDIHTLVRPFMSFKVSEYTTSLGIFFIFSLFKLADLKKIFYLPYLLIFLIILTGQILPRYYFEAFLLCCYFSNFDFKKNIFLKIFLAFQYLAIFFACILMLFTSYFKYNVVFDKNNFMKNMSYQYFNAKQLNKKLIEKNTKGNVLNFGQAREVIFMHSHIFGSRYLNAFSNSKGEIEPKVLKDFIIQNEIRYISGNINQKKNSCLTLQKIAKVNQLKVNRNPLNQRISFSIPLSEISVSNCKY